MISQRLKPYFEDYAIHHRTRGNQLTHSFGIPMIMLSLLGLLGNWALFSSGFESSYYFRIDPGTILIGIAIIWYLYLDWRLAIPFGFISLGMYFLGRTLPSSVCWTLFVLGWILQGIGHAYYEKKSPAFFKNLTHLLIGPLWVFAKTLRLKV